MGSVQLALTLFAPLPPTGWSLTGQLTIILTVNGIVVSDVSGTWDVTASRSPVGVLDIDLAIATLTRQGPVHRLTIAHGRQAGSRDRRSFGSVGILVRTVGGVR